MSGDKQQSGSKAIITCLFGLFRESIMKFFLHVQYSIQQNLPRAHCPIPSWAKPQMFQKPRNAPVEHQPESDHNRLGPWVTFGEVITSKQNQQQSLRKPISYLMWPSTCRLDDVSISISSVTNMLFIGSKRTGYFLNKNVNFGCLS